MLHKQGNCIKYLSSARTIFLLIILFLASNISAFATDLFINVISDESTPFSGVRVYAYTGVGLYTGIYRTADASGIATFTLEDFAAGGYKFRADSHGYQFWSDVFILPDTTDIDLVITNELTEVTVETASGISQNTRVYLYTGAGSYLSQYQITGTLGKVSFELPAGKEFKFRADILGQQYWSAVTEIISPGTNSVTLDAGGGLFTVTVQKSAGTPVTGVRCYLYSGSGSYLSKYVTLNDLGEASFELTTGSYKFRVDHLGYQFWTDVYIVPDTLSEEFNIPHQDIPAAITSLYSGTNDFLEGIKVYLYTESGSYLNQYQNTDANGQVVFNLPSSKSYKIRADYMGQQFWSDPFSETNPQIDINCGFAEVIVTDAGAPLTNVRVYAYLSSGSYLNLYQNTDTNGNITFKLPSDGTYNFRADYLGNQFWTNNVTLTPDIVNPVSITTGGGEFNLTVLKGADIPLFGAGCYLYTGSGSYLNTYENTDENGEVTFNVSDGSYKIRVDMLGYQFWTDVYIVPDTLTAEFMIPHQDLTTTVTSSYMGIGEPRPGIKVYLYMESGSYMNQYLTTDTNGQVIFNVPSDKSYKVRADYMGQQFWSDPFSGTDTSIVISTGEAEITVHGAGEVHENIRVYAYLSSGAYLNLYANTNAEGQVNFKLPTNGTYNFRADYMGSQFWVNDITLAPDTVNPVDISTGGGELSLTALKEAGTPLIDVRCYLYTSTGSYLNTYGNTDENGNVSFTLANGSYKIRVDHLGYQFYTDIYTLTTDISETFTIPHQNVTITVSNEYMGANEPLENIRVHLYTQAGSYMNQYQETNVNGNVVFSVPTDKSYKVRADYMGQQFWSDPFTGTDVSLEVATAEAEITVTSGGILREDVRVYAYLSSGVYLNLYGNTDADGKVVFKLPSAGTYNFRADYLGTQYWANDITLTLDNINLISLETGGGSFILTVLKGTDVPLTDVKCYLYTESGSYLNLNDNTDENGQVSFDLSDGSYKIRVDQLGYQFWTDPFIVPDTFSEVFTILHQDHTTTVVSTYQGIPEPRENIRVYLYTESGSYMNQYQNTDANGQVIFNVTSDKSYKVRADYMSQQFWSDPFTGTNTNIAIETGEAEITVTELGNPLENIRVYCYLMSGTYLNLYQNTDAQGKVAFKLPFLGTYKFRADYSDTQYWSDDTTLPADIKTPVNISTATDEPPVIQTQPASATVNVGQSAIFTVVATGKDLTYQWQAYMVDIPGATADTYTLIDAQYSNNGTPYRCSISNSLGTITTNVATLTVVDNQGPELTLEGSSTRVTAENFIDVSGVVNDTSSGVDSIVVTSDKYADQTFMVTIDSLGKFTGQIPLKIGDNILTVTATDASGNTITQVITVTYEISEVPVITILDPISGSTVTQDKITISGTVYSSLSPEAIRMTLNDQLIFPTATTTDYEYAFSFTNVNLIEGPNTLTIIAETPTKSASVQLDITYDTGTEDDETLPCEPEIFVSLVDDNVVTSGLITCEQGIESITVNGTTVAIIGSNGSFSFEQQTPMTGDEMTITVIVTDTNGQSSTTVRDVRKDFAAPVISLASGLVVSPAINDVVQTPFLLTGIITEENLAGLTINGETVGVLPGGTEDTWTFSVHFNLESGLNPPVTIEVWDYSGNSESTELLFNLSATVQLEVIFPQEGSNLLTQGTTLDVDITVRATNLDPSDEIKAEIDGGSEVILSRSGETANDTINISTAESDHELSIKVYNTSAEVISETTTGFTTTNTDVLPLEVIKQEPENNETGVDPNAFIALYFNKPINYDLLTIEVLETVHGKMYPAEKGGTDITSYSDIQLIDVHRDLETVPGGISSFSENTMAAFYPERVFAYDATIYVRVAYNGSPLDKFTFIVRPLPTFIQGIISNENGLPAKDVEIYLPDLDRKTVTNEDGNFGFGFGEPASRDIPGGYYQMIVNPGMKNNIYCSVEQKVNVLEGQLNTTSAMFLPLFDKTIPYRRIKTGQETALLDQGNLTLNLTNTKLFFPDGATQGDVYLRQLSFGKIPHGFLKQSIPSKIYWAQPFGILLEGSIGIKFAIPPIEGSYDYISALPERVILLGLDPNSMRIVPVGIAKVDVSSKCFISEGKVVMTRLDYIGYSFASEDMQIVLEAYANGEINIRELIGELEAQ